MKLRPSFVNIGLIAATLLLCYFPLCHRIEVNSIQLWDESRNATNAVEMLNNGHWFTRYFENNPDMWELKPPLLVWCQVICLKIFGYNELAVRFPSMFFSMCTIILLLLVGHKITGKIYAGAMASIILVSCPGYIGEHATRFGDHDAMLTFFSTALVCFSYIYFETRKTRYLILVFISLFLGWATKSITIFMFAPTLFLWALLNNQLKELLIKKSFWTGVISVLLLIVSYYLIREKTSPGYIEAVWQNEWFGRYFGTSKDFLIHKDPFWYYIIGFLNGRFTPYFFLLLAGAISLIAYKKMPFRKVLFFLILNWILFLLIISAGSKNFWYDLPLYPIAALFLGILIYQLYFLLSQKWVRITFSLIFIMLFYSTYSISFNSVFLPKKNSTDSWAKMSDYLRDESNLKHGDFKIYYVDYNSPVYLYIENAKSKHVTIDIERLGKFKKGDRVVIAAPELSVKLDSLYITQLIESKQGCDVKKVIGPKLPITD